METLTLVEIGVDNTKCICSPPPPPPLLPQQITGNELDMNIVVGAEVDPEEFDKQTERGHKQINKQSEPLRC